MSDMLEKLISVEKSAAALVTEAEAEAARRKAAATLTSSFRVVLKKRGAFEMLSAVSIARY